MFPLSPVSPSRTSKRLPSGMVAIADRLSLRDSRDDGVGREDVVEL